MEVEEALAQLGGTATHRQLRRVVERRALERSVAEGTAVQVRYGVYALAGAQAADLAAARLSGTLAGLSAAQANGWEVARPPDRPWIAVRTHRRGVDGRGVRLLYSDARETDPVQIVLTCARRLPLPEALAVADSALRSRQVDPDELVVAAAGLRGPGSRAARRVAALASPLKASVLESMLHGTLTEVEGLDLEPQLEIQVQGATFHADLGDRRRRVAVEAESWLFHASTPESFDRDVRRYTLMVSDHWLVLRYTHHQVFYDSGHVLDTARLAISAGESQCCRRFPA